MMAAIYLTTFPIDAADVDQVYQVPVTSPEVYSEPTDIIVLDAICSPGRQTNLSVGIYRHGKKIFRSISDTPVEFSVHDSTVGAAETNRSGIARMLFTVELGTGNYLISTRLTENDLFRGSTGYGLLSVVSQNAPILLVDFDSALYKGLSGKFDFAGVERLKPMDFASEALNELQKKYQIVYLTEWEVTDLLKIRRWIGHWKMPKAPILFWSAGEKVLKNNTWRSRELGKLIKQWSNVRAAVGGSSSAMVAFRDNRVHSIAVKSSWMREPGTLADWRAVKREIEMQ